MTYSVSGRSILYICKQNKGMGPLTKQQALLSINGSKEAIKSTLYHVLLRAQMCYVLYVQLLLKKHNLAAAETSG